MSPVRNWSAIDRFFASSPYEVRRDADPQTRKSVYSVARLEPIPDEISLIVGDIFHNARTALDLIAWQFVEANGSTPDPNTAFPIWRPSRTPKGQDMKALVGGKLKGAHPDVITAVITMEPCR